MPSCKLSHEGGFLSYLAKSLSTIQSVTDISASPTTTPIIVGSVVGTSTWWALASVRMKVNLNSVACKVVKHENTRFHWLSWVV